MLSCTIASAITFDKFIRKRLKTVKTAVAAATTGVSQGSGRRRPRGRAPRPPRRPVGHSCLYWPLTIFGDLMCSSDWSCWPALTACRPPWSWPLFVFEAAFLSGEEELLGATGRCCCCCERSPEGLTSPLIRSPPRPRNPPPPRTSEAKMTADMFVTNDNK